MMLGMYQAIISVMLCGNSIMLSGGRHVCFFVDKIGRTGIKMFNALGKNMNYEYMI